VPEEMQDSVCILGGKHRIKMNVCLLAGGRMEDAARRPERGEVKTYGCEVFR
jgi:hypothetical protein